MGRQPRRGRPERAAQERTLYAGWASQLERVLVLLGQAGDGSLNDLRRKAAALPVNSDIGMQQVKDALLADFDAAMASSAGTSEAVGPWLARTIPEYAAWLARIGGSPR